MLSLRAQRYIGWMIARYIWQTVKKKNITNFICIYRYLVVSWMLSYIHLQASTNQEVSMPSPRYSHHKIRHTWHKLLIVMTQERLGPSTCFPLIPNNSHSAIFPDSAYDASFQPLLTWIQISASQLISTKDQFEPTISCILKLS